MIVNNELVTFFGLNGLLGCDSILRGYTIILPIYLYTIWLYIMNGNETLMLNDYKSKCIMCTIAYGNYYDFRE